jgi:hypothetical protein
VTKNVKGLLEALRQSINEAILESNDVAAVMAALKRTGKCPVFSIDAALQDTPVAAAEPAEASDCAEELMLTEELTLTEELALSDELVLSDEDVEFLAAIGITDPSWSRIPSESRTR